MKTVALNNSYDVCQPIEKEDLHFFKRLLKNNQWIPYSPKEIACQSKMFIMPIENFRCNLVTKGFSFEHHQIIRSSSDNRWYIVFRVMVDSDGHYICYDDHNSIIRSSINPLFHHYSFEKSPCQEDYIMLCHLATVKVTPNIYYNCSFYGIGYKTLEIGEVFKY